MNPQVASDPSVLWAVALFAAVAFVLGAFALGFRAGRGARPHGLREVERGLRAVIAGDLEPSMDVDTDDPALEAAGLVADLARRLRDKQPRPDRRGPALAAALEGVAGRGAIVLDRDLNIVLASEGAAALFGAPPAQLEGRPLQDVVAPGSFREVAAAVAAARRGRDAFSVPLTIAPGPAGGRPHALVAYGGWPDAPPEAVALFVEPQPVPEEIDGEPPAVALERYWSILAGLPDAVLVVSEGIVVESNPRALAWLGTRLAGTSLRDLVAVEDVLLVLDRVARAAEGQPVEPVTCRVLPVEEPLRPRDVELHAAPVRAGGHRAAAVILRDLSSEQRLDRRARISDARLMAVLDGAADAMLVLSPPAVEGSPWRVGLVNRPMLELLGLDALAARGAPERELRALVAHKFGDPAAFAALFEAAARDPERTHEAALEMAGSGVTVEFSIRPVVGGDGDLVGRVVVARDITRHREVERQLVADAAALSRSRDALQRSYEQLASVNRDLEKKTGEADRLNRELLEMDRARAQLLGDVSHELHTPLVSIRGYCQMILEGRLGKINDEQRRGLEVALRNVDRMVELINNMIGLSRSEGPAALEVEPLDPRQVVADVLARHDDAARARGVRLEVQVDDPGARLAAEREGLTQVLDNLVNNAIKFNREGGRVRIDVGAGPAGFVKLEVADTGIGIPVEEHERVFERFFRGRGAAGTSGSGIGLATVRNVVERHGGAIEVESAVGQGTVFRILWPRATTAGSPVSNS